MDVFINNNSGGDGSGSSSESFSGRRTETVLVLTENNERPIKKNFVTAWLPQWKVGLYLEFL